MNDTATRQARWLIRRDMDEVLAIDRKSFTHAWDDSEFLVHLRQRNVIGVVSKMEFGDIDAFMLYALHKKHFEVLRFAVNPMDRRCGIGLHLINRMKKKCEQQRRMRIDIEVSEHDLAA